MAGAVLIAEAGGTLTTIDGLPFDPFRPDLLATNGRFHDELLGVLNGEDVTPDGSPLRSQTARL